MGPINRLAPPLAIMALIFVLSAQPGLSSGLSFDFVLRKVAHVTIFGALWLAIARATDWRRPLLATVLTLLYAASDEYHQSFVNDRHGTPVDVAIDAIGIAAAAFSWKLTGRRRGRPGPPWPWPAAPTASRAR